MKGIILTTKSELDSYIQSAVNSAFNSNLSKLKKSAEEKEFYTRHEATNASCIRHSNSPTI